MRSGSPRLSVLLPAYNAEKYVAAAIQSILQQTYTDFELLVADDASNDTTRSVIDSIGDSRIRHFHNDKNMGKTGTVAALFKHVRGSLLTVHDADDLSIAMRFEKQVAEFDKVPDLAMCGTSFVSVNENATKILETVIMKSRHGDILKDIDRQSQFHGPTMMMRTSILKELGGVYRDYFNNNYEDTDLAYRIAENHLCYNLESVLYRYRILANSLCRNNFTIRNRNLYKVVVFLAHERRERQSDSLSDGQPEVVDKYLDTITHQYENDKALIHREAAAYFMYWRLYRKAISEAFKAVKRNPVNFQNFRTLLYCLRKSVLTHD